MRGLRAVAITSTLLLAACMQKPEIVDSAKVIDAIEKAEEAQAAALGRRDLDRAVTVFAEHATLYVPGMPPAAGRKAIKALNAQVLKDPSFNISIDEASRKWWVSKSGDLATTTYTSSWTHTATGTAQPLTEQLVSQTTWARQADGSWRNVSDINAVYPASPAN